MRENYKTDYFLVKKIKPFQKYFPAALGAAFSTKFLFDAEARNSDF